MFALIFCYIFFITIFNRLLHKVTSVLINLSRARQVLRTLDKYAPTFCSFVNFKNQTL